MDDFKNYLAEEGLPSNEDRIEILLPTISNLGTKRLKTIKLRDGVDYKRQGPKPSLGLPGGQLSRHVVELDWYPKVQARQSQEARVASDEAVRQEGWELFTASPARWT